MFALASRMHFLPLKTIVIFDSLLDNNRPYEDYFKNFAILADMIFFDLNQEFNIFDRSLILASDCHQQGNGNDCGIFACLNMYGVINNDFDFVKKMPRSKSFCSTCDGYRFHNCPCSIFGYGLIHNSH